MTKPELIPDDRGYDMGDQIVAIKAAYAALNRGDVEGIVKDFDPETVRVEFDGSPTGGTYLGMEAVRRHVVAGLHDDAEPAKDLLAEMRKQ